MSERVIFHKEYSSESLCDIERDMSECFDSTYNIDMEGIPVDEHGFHEGYFEVTVTWKTENQT